MRFSQRLCQSMRFSIVRKKGWCYMEANYIQVSNNVLISNDGKYLTKVDSSNTLNRKLYEDEVEYEVSFGDVSIKLQLASFCSHQNS